jgi:signal transduction histidine kinase
MRQIDRTGAAGLLRAVLPAVARVDVEAAGGTLRVRVNDDGIGGADPARGSGLVGLRDRIEALGGTWSRRSPAGGGTTVSCEIPSWPPVGRG